MTILSGMFGAQNNIKIDYEAAANRFIIDVPFALKEIAKAFPNRMFDRTAKKWVAPAIRVNVSYIRESFDDAYLSQRAKDYIADFTSRGNVPANSTRTAPDGLLPAGYKTIPFPFQKGLYDRFYGQNFAAIFASMGTGKTKMAIDVASMRYLDKQIDMLFVLCPATLRENWAEELEKHCSIPYEHFIVHSTSPRSKKFIGKVGTFAKKRGVFRVAIGGIESFSKSTAIKEAVSEIMRTGGRIFVVVDESHNIKNPDAKQTRAICEICGSAPYKWIMTGTALSQGLEDLFSQYEFLNPGILGVGSYLAFKSRYVQMGGYEGKQVIGYNHVPELMELVKPWTIEIRKKDVLKDLPEKTYTTRPVALTDTQKEIYIKTRDDGLADLRKIIKDGPAVTMRNILQISTALQQITSGFISYFDDKHIRHLETIIPWDRSPKIAALMEIAEMADSSIIIWAKFTEEINQIVKAITKKYGPDSFVTYYGATPMNEREEAKRKFLGKEARFFIANPGAGGTGLTLNVSDLVVYFSNSFRLTNRLQSEDRNHRIGQKNPVTYVDIPARGTIDIAILAALRRKAGLLDFVNDSIRGDVIDRTADMWGDCEE